jgi:alpha-L-fucosidase
MQQQFSGTAMITLLLLTLSACGGEAPAPTETVQYEPTWESIQKHTAPQWYNDAKFGIFVHWGLYSVPAWATPSGQLHQVDWDVWFKNNAYAEWYLNTLRIDGSPTQEHHYKTYGKDFAYLDFIPKFNEEIQKWDPNAMAGLFEQIGAQYVVLTSKHHDGFTLWPSEVPNPHREPGQQHASRDVVGELSEAVRAHNMRMGLYYSGGLDWSFNEQPIIKRDEVGTTVLHTNEYAKYADAHWRELIERYQPAILWNDIAYPMQGDLEHILSDYYNRFPEGVINNRFGTRLPDSPRRHWDFTTPEYQKMDKITEEKWETCRGLGYSFGYNQVEGPEQTINEKDLIHLLIDIVSKNGNLLLNVGPMADGTIPEIQAERLRALGSWLSVNGEAIYGTRPWERADGKTADGIDVRFTRKGDALYAILLAKPGAATVTLDSVAAPQGASVTLLGREGALEHQAEGGNLTVTLPGELGDAHAYTLKIAPLS